ncbi:MAG TPA: MBL fold metallo-hydrolase [Nanoarchaeota archaeon]|nr:MBL fold metallo-hydrolase [Nanoarchaeota archaeon]
MVSIKFLGTGGGRFVTITQKRATGGFYIDAGKAKLYVDPGPGALVHAIKERIPLRKLDAIFVSHAHIDHINDAQVLIEALTNGCTKKNGIFIGSISAVEDLDEYHKSYLEKIVPLNQRKNLSLKILLLRQQKLCIQMQLQ